jgi:MOSC domain-containing protein YiiM|tara:strand:- start:20 stop:604 length:585 start_codon:yes stop_codon:yes gene_type:complete
MKRSIGQVDSVYLGSSEDELGKQSHLVLNAQLSGFVGDRHGSLEREAWAKGDKQVSGTIRRNERQWSAVSVEELADITEKMNLTQPLSAASVGANLCLSGVTNLSHLPKGSILKFPSGAELIVEEYNPPCVDMDEKLASMHTTKNGADIPAGAFLAASKYSRGIVGVIDVPGIIHAGDQVTVLHYKSPTWLNKV